MRSLITVMTMVKTEEMTEKVSYAGMRVGISNKILVANVSLTSDGPKNGIPTLLDALELLAARVTVYLLCGNQARYR